jgi:hypothetical protein
LKGIRPDPFKLPEARSPCIKDKLFAEAPTTKVNGEKGPAKKKEG